jgi:hypothetical protein
MDQLKKVLSKYSTGISLGGGEEGVIDRKMLAQDLDKVKADANRNFNIWVGLLLVIFLAGIIAMIVVKDSTFTVAMFAVEGFFCAGILRPMLNASKLFAQTNLLLVVAKHASEKDLSLIIEKLLSSSQG